MSDISRNTFNEDNRYEKVIFQAGKPIADSDLNELQDIVSTNLERIVKAGFGDKSIYNTSTTYYGFNIVASSTPTNNFLIKAGEVFINGKYLRIDSDMEYTAQTESHATLSAPTGGTRTDLIYLDVWETEYGIADDANLIFSTESGSMELSKRDKLHWVVNVVTGTTTCPTNTATHSYMQLATIARTTSSTITTAMLTNIYASAGPTAPTSVSLTTGFMTDDVYNSVSAIQGNRPVDSNLSWILATWTAVVDSSGISKYEAIAYPLDNSGNALLDKIIKEESTVDFVTSDDDVSASPRCAIRFSNLTSGVRYHILVRAYDSANPQNVGAFCPAQTIIAGIGSAYDTGRLVMSTVTPTSKRNGVLLSWDAVSNAVGYEVYASTSSISAVTTTMLCYSGPATSCFVNGNPNSTIYWWVRCYDAAGRFSSDYQSGSTANIEYQQFVIVAKSGGDYSTITSALNSITDASVDKPYVIYVMPGIYLENPILKPYVDIVGADADRTWIYGTVQMDSAGASCIIKGIQFYSGGSSNIYIYNGSIKLYDCIINGATNGIYALSGTTSLLVYNCSFYSNSYSIYFNPSSSASTLTIRNSDIGITAGVTAGVYVGEGYCNVYSSRIKGTNYGIYVTSGSTGTFVHASSIENTGTATGNCATYVGGSKLFYAYNSTFVNSGGNNSLYAPSSGTTVYLMCCSANADSHANLAEDAESAWGDSKSSWYNANVILRL